MNRKVVVLGIAAACAALLVVLLATRRPSARSASLGPSGGGRAGGRTALGNVADLAAGAAREGEPRSGTIVRASWGNGVDQLGRSRPREGNPEAPASLALDAQGRIVVLDSVNGRIVRYDAQGRVVGTLATTQSAPQEIATARDGSLLVMDRLADKSVAILDADGHLKGELPVTGKGMEQGGSATGLFVDDTGVYVEREHSQLVRIGDVSGQPDAARPELDGRPSRDGRSLLSAGVVDPAAGRLWLRRLDRASGALVFQKQVVLDSPYFAILLLDSDRAGTIYVGVHSGREVAPGDVRDEAVQVACVGPTGDLRGVARMPANTMPEEIFRELEVQDDGTILHLEISDEGATVRAYRCS